MNSFPDFVTWAGSQRKAAVLIDLSESMVSLILSGDRPLKAEHAIRAEIASDGLFRCDDLMPNEVFVRDGSGAVSAYHVRLADKAA